MLASSLALFPGLPCFFVLQFAFSIIYRYERGGRPGNTYHMSGYEVGEGGKGLHSNNIMDFIILHHLARPLMFTKSQPLCLTSKKLAYCNHLAFTLCPPNVIHVISVLMPSLFYAPFPHLCIIKHKPKNKNGGALEMRLPWTQAFCSQVGATVHFFALIPKPTNQPLCNSLIIVYGVIRDY